LTWTRESPAWPLLPWSVRIFESILDVTGAGLRERMSYNSSTSWRNDPDYLADVFSPTVFGWVDLKPVDFIVPSTATAKPMSELSSVIHNK
jgi:hypothetical protein